MSPTPAQHSPVGVRPTITIAAHELRTAFGGILEFHTLSRTDPELVTEDINIGKLDCDARLSYARKLV